MGFIQKDALRTTLISYIGIGLGYINKGVLFLIILTTEQIGLINLLFSLGILFAQFSNLGLISSVWKFFPFLKDTERKNRGFFVFMFIATCLGIILFCSLAILFRGEIELQYLEKSPLFVEYYFWFIPLGVATAFYHYFEIYLRSFYKNVISVVAQDIVLRILVTVLLVLYWLKIISFYQLVIWHSLMHFIPPLILSLYLIKIGEFSLTIRYIDIPKKMKRIIFQYSSFNYVSVIGLVLLNSLDVIMLAQYVGLKSAGVFSTIMFLIGAILIPYRSLVRIASPMVADYWKQRNFEQMQNLYQKVSSVSLFIGLSFFLVFWLNIDFLFSFLKPDFQIGIWIFLYLMIGRLLDMYFGLNGTIFVTSKKYKFDLIFTVILICFVYGLKLLLIPMWGSIGAAISTSMAFVIYNLGRVIFVYRVYKIHPFTKEQFLMIGLSLIALILGYLINFCSQNTSLKLVINQCVLIGAFFFPIYYFELEKESINYLRKGTSFIKSKLSR